MKNQIYLLFFFLLFSSCKAYKEVVYFQDPNEQEIINQEIKNYTTLKIQKDDLLDITISSLEPKAAAIYNIGNSSLTSATATDKGYLVDQNGDIQIPSFGSIHLEGLTTAEAKILIAEKLTPFLGNPIVNLKLTNFKISILGDVTAPGVYQVPGERISLIEAISKAGDLSITAFRNNILLIREGNGKRQFIRLDINKKDVFNSPYYYLQPNDIIYVQPRNAKYASVDNNYRYFGIISSGLSIALILITIFK